MIYITIIVSKLQKVIINVQRLATYLWSTTINHRNATFFTIVYKLCKRRQINVVRSQCFKLQFDHTNRRPTYHPIVK